MRAVLLCGGIGAVGAGVAGLFGGWDAALTTLVIFMALDYITGIVVGVSVTAVMLGLTVRLYQRYRTLDMDEIAERIRGEGK